MSDDTPTKCPVCDNDALVIGLFTAINKAEYLNNPPSVEKEDANIYKINCKICGTFYTFPTNTRIHKNTLLKNFKDETYLISGFIRNSDNPPKLLLNYDELEELINSLKKYSQLENKFLSFLYYIKNNSTHYGKTVPIDYNNDYPFAYSYNDDEFIYIIKTLIKYGYIESGTTDARILKAKSLIHDIKITKEGLDYISEKNPYSKQIFVAMKLKELNGIILPNTYRYIKDKIYNETGFVLHWMNMKGSEPFVEKICDRIIGDINRSRFLIADITHRNENVMYEAGYAHGIGIDVMFACEQSVFKEYFKNHEDPENKLPFDTRQYNHFEWEEEKLDDFAEIIIDFINARYPDVKRNH